jgi:hypothetical protein
MALWFLSTPPLTSKGAAYTAGSSFLCHGQPLCPGFPHANDSSTGPSPGPCYAPSRRRSSTNSPSSQFSTISRVNTKYQINRERIETTSLALLRLPSQHASLYLRKLLPQVHCMLLWNATPSVFTWRKKFSFSCTRTRRCSSHRKPSSWSTRFRRSFCLPNQRSPLLVARQEQEFRRVYWWCIVIDHATGYVHIELPVGSNLRPPVAVIASLGTTVFVATAGVPRCWSVVCSCHFVHLTQQ